MNPSDLWVAMVRAYPSTLPPLRYMFFARRVMPVALSPPYLVSQSGSESARIFDAERQGYEPRPVLVNCGPAEKFRDCNRESRSDNQVGNCISRGVTASRA